MSKLEDIPGIIARTPTKDSVGSPRDMAFATVFHLHSMQSSDSQHRNICTSIPKLASLPIAVREETLTLCIRTYGFGPRQVSHTIGKSARSQPSASGSANNRFAILAWFATGKTLASTLPEQKQRMKPFKTLVTMIHLVSEPLEAALEGDRAIRQLGALKPCLTVKPW